MVIYDPETDMPKRQSPPRSKLETMLRDAVANSGGEPVKHAPPQSATIANNVVPLGVRA